MSSLSTALSALYAQRRALEVTGHNIANANTEGYSRQRVDLQANSGPVNPALWSTWKGVGQGVDVTGTSRLRDAFLDLRANQEHAVQGQLLMSQQILTRIELGFGEPSELGLGAQFNDFWAGWGDVANNPTDLAARNALMERASTLTTSLRGGVASLTALSQDLTDQLDAQLDQINLMARNIAQLNDGIVDATNANLSPNDLMDQRDLLVAKLSDLMGVSVKAEDGGAITVLVGGTALVRGNQYETLTRGGDPTQTTVEWTKDGYPASVDSGSTAALLTGINDTVPRYVDQLDAIAVRLRDLVNGVHADGQDLDGNPGVAFFEGTGAGDIRLSAAVAGQPRRLAAAAAGGGTADNNNALLLAALSGHRDRPLNPGDPAYLAGDGPDLLYRSMVVGLGVENQAVNRRVDIQSEITRQVDAARDGQSGVNLDEEMTNMLAYQRAYDAAARFMTTIDEMLDRLINATGLVGR